MKKINTLIILLFSLLIWIETCSATTIENYQFCRGMTPPEDDNYSKPVECIEPTAEFTTTDTAAYIIVKFSPLTKDDKIYYAISDPDETIIDEDLQTVPNTLDTWYGVRIIKIDGQNRQPGTYNVRILINDNEAVYDNFMIKEEISSTCEDQGFYCCPPSKLCLSAQDGTCESGSCCENENKCVTYSSNYFSRREIMNCDEEGLKDCKKIIKLYEYSIHGRIDPPQTGVIYFRGIDADCSDKKDVAIAYYDEGTSTWVEKVTNVEKTDTVGYYKATALLDHLGYIALVRTSQCVPLLCTYGGYRTTPVGGYVNFGEAITFTLCGMISGCELTDDGTCNKKCSDSIDLDCPECTTEKGDCCLISRDGICDLDCAPYTDPDCCTKPNELCCPGGGEQRGFSGCDKNCGISDTKCSSCSSREGDCCAPASDGICDPDCPKLSNRIGYLDPDCCNKHNIPITNNYGDCCKESLDTSTLDQVCDFDCIAGMDIDCITSASFCGDRKCASFENPSNCDSDCYCGDATCSTGETCANCEKDCGKCCGNGICDSGEDYFNCPNDCTYYTY